MPFIVDEKLKKTKVNEVNELNETQSLRFPFVSQVRRKISQGRLGFDCLARDYISQIYLSRRYIWIIGTHASV